MRSLHRMLVAAPVFVLLCWLVAPRRADTIPLFARERSEGCAECHSAVPRLNAAGIAFLRNGYRRPGETGAPPWTTHALPLSVTGSASVLTARTQGSALTPGRERFTEHTSLERALSAQSAGALTSTVSYNVRIERPDSSDDLRASAAFVQYRGLAENGSLGLRAGAWDAEFPWLSTSLRTTLHPYLAPVTFSARGFELSGLHSSWAYAAGLTTGTLDHLEDTYFTIGRGTRGRMFGARMLFDRQPSDLALHFWLQHLQAEAAGSFALGRLLVVPAYVFDRFDDRPGPGIHDRHQYYLLEILLPLDSAGRWTVTMRFEHEYRTRTVSTPEEDHQLDVLNLSRTLSANATVALELAHFGDNVSGPRATEVESYVRLGF